MLLVNKSPPSIDGAGRKAARIKQVKEEIRQVRGEVRWSSSLVQRQKSPSGSLVRLWAVLIRVVERLLRKAVTAVRWWW